MEVDMMQAAGTASITRARLHGRVIIISGAAQGIGAAYARALAAEGALLSLCDLQEPSVIADEIRTGGAEVISQVTDITDPSAVAALIDATVERFGRIDVLVNNAALFGTLVNKPFTEISSEEWDRVMMVNTRGPFECAKAVVPIMRRQGRGKIINVASGTVFKGMPYLLHYVSSKGAVIAMTRALARELGADGIAVNCIAPGLTMSENVRLKAQTNEVAYRSILETRCFKREQVPEDLLGAMLFLASAESDFMTGQTMLIDGGSAMH